jgi:hypothetical protein
VKVKVFVAEESYKSKMLETLLDFPEFEDLDIEIVPVDDAAQAEEALLQGIKVVPSIMKILDDGQISILSGLPSQNMLIEWFGLDPAPTFNKD